MPARVHRRCQYLVRALVPGEPGVVVPAALEQAWRRVDDGNRRRRRRRHPLLRRRVW